MLLCVHPFSPFVYACVCACQDVRGATDTREQPVDVGGAGRLRLLQTVPPNHHGAQGSQIYPFGILVFMEYAGSSSRNDPPLKHKPK